MREVQNPYENRPVLVTGAAGFVGSTLVRRLCDLGAQVRAVDIVDSDFGANMFNLQGYENRIDFVAADIGDTSAMEKLVKDVDIVFNLAAQIGHGFSMENPLTDLDLNLRSHVSFLELCRKHIPRTHIVQGSTRQVYGRPKALPVDESHPVQVVDVNAINRLALENYLLLYHRVHGLGATIVRMTNVYGPRMRIIDGRQTFIGLWLRRVIEDDEIEIFGDGSQIRDLNHVDDVVDALLRAGSSKGGGEIYNLGAEPISLLALAENLILLAGAGRFKIVPFPEGRRVIDIGDYHGDYGKISHTLGWNPSIEIDGGLLDAISYYRDHFEHYCETAPIRRKA